MRQLYAVGLSLLAIISSAAISNSQEIVRATMQSSGDRTMRVDLYPGTGLTINFMQAGNIETIFLDNPSLIGIDSDGCLAGIQSNCSSNQASLLHIKLLDGSPVTGTPKSKRSGLTVVVVDKKGQRQVYLFDLRKGTNNRAGRVALIDVMPTSPSESSRVDLATQVARGAVVAKQRGLLNDNMSGKCDLIVSHLRSGKDIATTARLTGVSETFIRKLAQLGAGAN